MTEVYIKSSCVDKASGFSRPTKKIQQTQTKPTSKMIAQMNKQNKVIKLF